ncbi:mitotic spindle assembly checkpoint protein MAD2B-like [Bicyclus anynana]|uniref:Mitotic spindle assembly checkpoint protein MAD2B-like n=1 Tax=Bicyclus anynana TaxID=110368 RepID=A0A6J1N7R7_BICAN|nr:mitotic spindle assembly checkpoint protein MAD2B-like [Bicyclus anynana]
MDACFVDITVEFLSVAFHNILYYASVYPKVIFETRKKYNIVVYRCLHPAVIMYIDKCLKSLAEAFKSNALHRVELVMTDLNHKPEFSFVFDFEFMANFDETADAYLVRIEQNLRAFCLLLGSVSKKFNALPEDSSFKIQLYTTESVEVALESIPQAEDFPLVEVEEETEELDNIMPLMRFSIRNYNVYTHIELPKPWTFCS